MGLKVIGVVGGVAGLMVVLAGCGSTAPPAANIDPYSGQAYPNITVEPKLQPWIVFRPAVVEKSEAMRVTVPIRLATTTQNPIAVQYKFTFKDGNGVPLRVQSDWKYLQLEPNMLRDLQGSALDSNAADWYLEIRSGR